MVDQSRIDTLRRRVREDPASVAFSALAEEYRRAGLLTEAVETCRAGLERQPAYVSARVTLARALAALGDLDAATSEFARVIDAAPENLAAQRDLAELYLRRGDLSAALLRYRVASELAPQDADLREAVTGLEGRLGGRDVPPAGGLVVPSQALTGRPHKGEAPALHLVSDEDLPGEWRFADPATAARQLRGLEQFLAQILRARGSDQSAQVARR